MPRGIYDHKPHSEETKAKIGKALERRKLSVEHKKNIGESRRGKTYAPMETRTCADSNCDITFECKVNNPKEYCSISCSSKRLLGKNNPMFGTHRFGKLSPNWQGGTSNLPYAFGFNEEFKTLIRERDNHTCQLCGKTKEEEGRNLCVHYIRYDKENKCSNEHDFITLCQSCNSGVNGNRKSWTEFFQQKLKLCEVSPSQLIQFCPVEKVFV